MKSGQDIFSTLAKYNSAEDENYLTEAFVFLLNTLLAGERPLAVEILNKLCGVNQVCFDVNEDISVSTQEITPQGTPDIKISCPGKLAYIEVKYESDLGIKQVERYLEALKSSGVPNTCLVLLTKFSLEFAENETKPHKYVRWFEVHHWLEKAKSKDAICEYLIHSLKSFLEEKGMSIERVTWEYINGVTAFNNLINMIGAVLESLHIPLSKTYPKAVAWDTRGFYLKDNEFWCGVHYSNHMVMTFEMLDKTKFDLSRLPNASNIWRPGKQRLWRRLPFEDIHFFSLDKDKQFDEIKKFIEAAYTEAQQMRVK